MSNTKEQGLPQIECLLNPFYAYLVSYQNPSKQNHHHQTQLKLELERTDWVLAFYCSACNAQFEFQNQISQRKELGRYIAALDDIVNLRRVSFAYGGTVRLLKGSK